ncbi:MAG: cytochrome b/b6 domain-containing protein [Anaerolineae bacterium]|jgi:formate dehydrogenase subunit gamma
MKRLYAVLGLLIVGLGGAYVAFVASRLVPADVSGASSTYDLLFTSAWWTIPVAALFGVFLGAYRERRRPKPEVKDGKILRHDDVMFLEHWSVALSTVLLAITGILLGFFFIPRFVQDPETVGFMLNLHFVGVLVFTFGVCHYVTDLFLVGGARELLPSASDLKESITQYTAKLGMAQQPRAGKYFPTQKITYPVWAVSVLIISLTGILKVAAHAWNLPAGFMGAMTWLHDASAVVMIVLLVFHVVAGALVPWSWPLLRSMLTGYVSEEYARKNHPGWVEGMVGEESPTA